MQPPMSNGTPDDFQTPPPAILPLLPYLKKDWLIWECACGKGNLVNALNEKGFLTEGTDVLTGHNFLTWKPEKFDCIITNPPFSLKDEFLRRAYQLGVGGKVAVSSSEKRLFLQKEDFSFKIQTIPSRKP